MHLNETIGHKSNNNKFRETFKTYAGDYFTEVINGKTSPLAPNAMKYTLNTEHVYH